MPVTQAEVNAAYTAQLPTFNFTGSVEQSGGGQPTSTTYYDGGVAVATDTIIKEGAHLVEIPENIQTTPITLHPTIEELKAQIATLTGAASSNLGMFALLGIGGYLLLK